MPISGPPLSSALPQANGFSMWPKPWGNFFTQVWLALAGWRKTYTGTLTHDFGSINSQTQATQTVTVTGARIGDAVLVRPTTAMDGVILDGTVTADDTVTVRAVNYSTSAKDPASQVYVVIVFQQ